METSNVVPGTVKIDLTYQPMGRQLLGDFTAEIRIVDLRRRFLFSLTFRWQPSFVCDETYVADSPYSGCTCKKCSLYRRLRPTATVVTGGKRKYSPIQLDGLMAARRARELIRDRIALKQIHNGGPAAIVIDRLALMSPYS